MGYEDCNTPFQLRQIIYSREKIMIILKSIYQLTIKVHKHKVLKIKHKKLFYGLDQLQTWTY